MKHNEHTYSKDEIFRYLNDKMTNRECYVFERKMEADPFLMDAVQGFEKWEEEDIKQDLRILDQKLKDKGRKRVLVPVWIKVAAVLIMVVCVGGIVYLFNYHPIKPVAVNEVNLSDKKDSIVQRIEDSVEKIKEEKHEESVKKEKVEKTVVAVPKKEIAEPQSIDIVQETVVIPKNEVEGIKSDKLAKANHMAGVKVETLNEKLKTEDIEVELKKSTIAKSDAVKSLRKQKVEKRGRVVDESGQPIPGVSVFDSALNTGTITNLDGSFVINGNPDTSDLVTLSFIGYQTKELSLSGDSVALAMLEPDNSSIDEVVVVGYGAQRKVQSVSSSVESVVMEDIRPAQGLRKYKKELEEKMHYPFVNGESKKRVVLEIKVNAQGSIIDVTYSSEIEEEFAEELKTEIISGPAWIVPEDSSTYTRKFTLVFKKP